MARRIERSILKARMYRSWKRCSRLNPEFGKSTVAGEIMSQKARIRGCSARKLHTAQASVLFVQGAALAVLGGYGGEPRREVPREGTHADTRMLNCAPSGTARHEPG